MKQCDLSSLSNVNSFCDSVIECLHHIDVLVCFAAAVGDNPANVTTTRTPTDGLQMMFQCNYLSHYLIIHRLMRLLKQSPHGARIIVTSSQLHRLGHIQLDRIAYNYSRHIMLAYADSKLALIMMARELAERLMKRESERRSNFSSSSSSFKSVFLPKVYSFHPGAVSNTAGNNNIPHWYGRYLIKLCTFVHSKSPLDGAQTLIYLTLSPNICNFSGGYFGNCQLITTNYNRSVNDPKLRRQLWDMSLDLLRKKFKLLLNIDEDLDNDNEVDVSNFDQDKNEFKILN